MYVYSTQAAYTVAEGIDFLYSSHSSFLVQDLDGLWNWSEAIMYFLVCVIEN